MAETLERWRANGRTFRHKGHAIFYRDEGPADGEVLLCLHGFPTASWDWHRLWPELTSRWRVLALDMLGYGFSDKPADYDYSLLDQADIHEELLAFLGVRRVHLLGHDVGDSVALELLARKRLSIDSVCLLNGGLFPETHRPTVTQKLLASPIGFLVGRFMTERKFAASFSRVFGADTQPSADQISDFWRLISFNHGQRVVHRLMSTCLNAACIASAGPRRCICLCRFA